MKVFVWKSEGDEWPDYKIKTGRIRMYYELQPLRIQAGWSIEYNNFSEYDMSIHGEEDCYELNEDLLQLKCIRANIIIAGMPT